MQSYSTTWESLAFDADFIRLADQARTARLVKLGPLECLQAYNSLLPTNYLNILLIFNLSEPLYGPYSGITRWPTEPRSNWSTDGIVQPTMSKDPGILDGVDIQLCGQSPPCNASQPVNVTLSGLLFPYCPALPTNLECNFGPAVNMHPEILQNIPSGLNGS